MFDDLLLYQFLDKKNPEAEITAHLEVSHSEMLKLGLDLGQKEKYDLVVSRKLSGSADETRVYLDFIRLDKKIIIKTPNEQKRFLNKKGGYEDNIEGTLASNILKKITDLFILIPADRIIIRDPTPMAEKSKIEDYIKDSLIQIANSEDDDRKVLYEQFTTFIDKISPLIEEVKTVKEANKVIDVKFLSEDKTDIPLSTIGGGNNELLLLLHEIIISGGKILAIEEPEIHLHPEAERKLYRLMQEFSATTQMFIVTHSPVFVEPDEIKNLFRIIKKGTRTEICSMRPQQYIDRERLKQELNAENCEMFFADKVLLVEGISDKIFMDGLIQRYSKSTAEIKVVSSYSKDNFEVYVDLLRIFKIPYLIMTDLDALKGRFQIKPIYRAIRNRPFKNRYEKIQFLKTQYIHVLAKGDLESCYPKHYRRHISKPLDALFAIHNLTDEEYDSPRMTPLREVIEVL